MKKTIYILPIIILALIGCSNSSEDDLIDSTPIENKITYTANIKPIIDNNCNFCHSNPPVNGAPISLVTYQNVTNNSSKILNRISRQAGESGAMPFGGPRLPQASIDLFEQWIQDGLLEN